MFSYCNQMGHPRRHTSLGTDADRVPDCPTLHHDSYHVN